MLHGGGDAVKRRKIVVFFHAWNRCASGKEFKQVDVASR